MCLGVSVLYDFSLFSSSCKRCEKAMPFKPGWVLEDGNREPLVATVALRRSGSGWALRLGRVGEERSVEGGGCARSLEERRIPPAYDLGAYTTVNGLFFSSSFLRPFPSRVLVFVFYWCTAVPRSIETVGFCL